MKIEHLTENQKSKFQYYTDKWMKIGLSTEPLEVEKAKNAVIKSYHCAGLEPPKKFYRFDSPLSAAFGRVALENIYNNASVSASVWDSVSASVRASVSDSVWDSVSDSVSDSVWDSVSASVSDSVRASVRDSVYGSQESGWLSFYDYMSSELNIKECNKLEGIMESAKHCGWWTPFKDSVIIQEKPELIKLDDRNVIHCEDGPAIRYRDGFSVYGWHGVIVPDYWITDKSKLTANTALKWGNVEQRRCACEIIGWDKVLVDLNPTIVDTDIDPQVGQLLEVELPDMGRERFLKVECGTNRTFALPVPPGMTTALEANAWTYGLDRDILKQLEIRT